MSCKTNAFACVYGNCEEVSNGTFACICNAGYKNDNSFFHLENCALPENLLLGLFITFGLFLGLPMLIVAVRTTFHAKGPIRRVGIRFSLACATFCLAALVLYLQDGIFEVMAVFLGLNMAAQNMISQQTMKMTVAPVLTNKHRKLDTYISRNLERIFTSLNLLIVACACVMSAFARTPSYNYCIIAYLVVIAIAVEISSLLQYWYVQQLIEIVCGTVSTNFSALKISNPGASHQLTSLVFRLRKFRRSVLAFAIYGPTLYAAIIGLYFGFGEQLPFIWTLWPALSLAHFIKYYGCLVLLWKAEAPLSSDAGVSKTRSVQVTVKTDQQSTLS